MKYSIGQFCEHKLNKFEVKIRKWLETDPNWFQRQLKSAQYFRYNRLRTKFRFFGLIHFVAKYSMIASSPAIAYFVYEKITATQATIAAITLLFLFILTSLLNSWSERKSNPADQASSEAWVRIGDLITSVKSSATLAANRDDTVIAALGVIETYARQITKSPKSTISVSLALYDGNSTTSMKIRHRNPGNERPTGRNLKNLNRVLGHRACQAGPEPRVVSDLKKFGSEGFFSPTQSVCNYRSMVIIPVTARGNGKIKGFVSIDSTQPHAFHGSIADVLVVTTEPLISHIEEQY